MSNARNLSKFKPSSSGLVETADIADDAINADKIADNAVTTDRIADDAVTTAKVNPAQTDITSVGTLTSATISGDLTVDTNTLFVDASENNVGIGTTTPATSLEISGTTANTQGGVFPRIQISTTADNNPTYSGSLDIVEKQSSATSTAVFGENHLYGFRMMLDGNANVLKWFSGSATTVTERMGLDRDTGNLTLNSGNLIMGTSGKGIDFSATGDGTGSMSSEIFDDYEEGTWTASLISGSGITFSASERNYVKVGRLVYVNIACTFSGTSSNRVEISGLPFTSSDTSACTIFHSGGSLPTHGAFLAQSHSGHNRISGGKGTDMTYSDVNGTTMRITVTYLATA